MLRLLLVVACLVLASCATTDKHGYIRVQGIGSTFEQAKQDAFVKAIEIAVGTVMVSERETNNRQLKNEVLAYSSGFVDEFKIVSSENAGSKLYLTMDVKVAEQKLANRILSQGKSSVNIEGERHSMQYSGYLNNKQQGDRVLATVLRDYPKRAFNVKQGKYTVNVDIDRNLVLVIPYEFTWNYNYLVSLNEALKLLEDGSAGFMQSSIANILIMSKDPKSLVVGERNSYKFNDIARVDQLNAAFNDVPRINLVLYNQYNSPVLFQCWSIGGGVAFHAQNNTHGFNRNTIIYGNARIANNLRLDIPPGTDLYRAISNSHRLELSIMSDSECKK